MGKGNKSSFSKNLGLLAGFAGAILGYSASINDTETSSIVIGILVGFAMGYVIGWIVGEFLQGLFKIILAAISILIIAIRVYNLLSHLFE